MTKQRTKAHYGLLALAAVLLGLGIQFVLGYTEARREAAEATRILSGLESTAADTVGAELQRREDEQAAAAEALAVLPQQRRAAYDASAETPLPLLVNRWHPLPEDYAPELTLVASVDNRDYYLDVCCADAFLEMMADCSAAGCHPYVCSAYRTQQKQQELFDNKVLRVMILDHASLEEAPAIAEQSVARPGTSEHQLGLAVDIIDRYYTNLDEGQEETDTQQWLMENCWRYGFLLRYPNGTTEITGIIYEPWHYRYVGRAYAEEITRMGITLEEYLALRAGR